MVRTDIKRLWLRERWSTVPGTFATLAAALQDAAFSSLEGVKAGSISATSANGHSVQFASTQDNAGPEDYAALGGEMLDLYDIASAALVSAGYATPTDAQIYAEMLDRLQPVTSFRGDYSTLRCAR